MHVFLLRLKNPLKSLGGVKPYNLMPSSALRWQGNHTEATPMRDLRTCHSRSNSSKQSGECFHWLIDGLPDA